MEIAADRAAPPSSASCRNCAAPLSARYCSSCGQDHLHERLSLIDLARNALDAITNMEARVLRTAIELTLRPGLMARDYVDGRRIVYISPARYPITTCALWWFAVLLQPGARSAVWYVEYAQLINLLCIPPLTLAVQLAFAGSRQNYAESLTFMLYTTGQVFLWRAGMAFLGLIPAVRTGTGSLVLTWTDQGLYIIYMVWALLQFYRGRVRWIGARITAAIVGVLVLGAAVNVALMLLKPH